MGFEDVKLEEALSDPTGFYAQYARIRAASRRVVLLRFPRDFDVGSLEGEKVSFSNTFGVNDLGDNQHTLRITEGPTASTSLALAVPGNKALQIQTLDEPVWAVTRKEDRPLASKDETIDFDRDLGARTEPIVALSKRKQPEGLGMNLSAIDIATVINRRRHKMRGTKRPHKHV